MHLRVVQQLLEGEVASDASPLSPNSTKTIERMTCNYPWIMEINVSLHILQWHPVVQSIYLWMQCTLPVFGPEMGVWNVYFSLIEKNILHVNVPGDLHGVMWVNSDLLYNHNFLHVRWFLQKRKIFLRYNGLPWAVVHEGPVLFSRPLIKRKLY